ncbi:MAG: hypothetical protein GOMPHAMPRED_001682 [Gomphillus americanus]|uniref:Uncharacterized protein n=1 Tax=Gomphillus americanus TaxID=1940652 RepID=A0A8H3F6Z5_9LECA|nr:MAG: hypothetical protein GOMPHAMPRED_001682 [Gomphillus americanus]
MSSFQIIHEIFWAVLGPWMILGTSASYLPGALLNLVRTEGVASLLHWSHVKTAWFSALWSFMGREIRQENGPQVTALLQGRVSQGAIVDEPQTQPLSGVVLEIGPGVGYWVDIFSAFNNPADEKATKSGTSGKLKIYGVEPNRHAHSQLKEHIKAAGLEDVYEILPVGIQSILKEDNKISEGSVDCIVTLLCLCSIPEPEENIRALYKLLKPGGRWYLDEHVRVKRSIFFGWYQYMISFIWPVFIGGCQLCRDTETSLRQAGKWTTIDLAQPVEEPCWPPEVMEDRVQPRSFSI